MDAPDAVDAGRLDPGAMGLLVSRISAATPADRIHDARNRLVVLPWEGGPAVAKLFPRTVIGWLTDRWRGSKARRSYAAARRLGSLGIGTPEPLGWCDGDGRVGGGVYLCRQVRPGEQIRTWLRGADGWETALPSAGAFLRRMHAAGVDHRDCSPGNLIGDGREWHLVDLNRIRFDVAIAPLAGAARLQRMMSKRTDCLRALVDGYAAEAGIAGEAAWAAYVRAHDLWRRGRWLADRTRAWRRRLSGRR